jgi:hypothetical protein
MKKKKLTIITWDANYRENVTDGLKCLKKQTVFDELEFIHVEWGSKVNKEILECNFIKKHCLNLPFRDIRPSFDTGVQWNYGLHAAPTSWISYCHLDIIPRDFYEKIIKNIEEIENNNSNVIYMEGWYINQNEKGGAAGLKNRQERYIKWKEKLGEDFDLLAYKYQPASPRRQNSIGLTIKKDELIKDCNGWAYNIPHLSEWWTAGGISDPLFHSRGNSLLGHLKQTKRAHVKVPNMVGFSLPHPAPNNKVKFGSAIYPGGMKHYTNFIEEWIPQDQKNITII